MLRFHQDRQQPEDVASCHSRLLKKLAPALAVSLVVVLFLPACDRMTTKRDAQLVKDADAKSSEGNFLQAIDLYEKALDGSSRSADIHYRLALLYDDKLNDPLHALHHFKRYLTLAPNGPRAADVKNFMKRDELALLTSLSGDSVMSRTEGVRLKNENLSLRKEIEERLAHDRATSGAGQKVGARETLASQKKQEAKPTAAKKAEAHERIYIVQPGDTLASISRKFYKTSSHWQKILKANADTLSSPAKLKPGQRLMIP
ncbi:MAG: LysM peptidoglycan-binding domain-containing protein [Verrucomicrobiota bacterium]